MVLSACGGGGGSSSSSSSTTSSSSATTYTSSGSVGEVLNFTIDTAASPPTYSYTIVQSSYGLTNQTGSGTLTLNADGSFTPSGSTNSRVYALPNGLLVGGIKLNLQGTDTVVPLLGVSSPVTSINSLVGTYNYITTYCNAKANGYPTYPNCGTSYGTVKVNANGTYTECVSTNISTSPTCSSSTGTISNQANGIWEYVRTGSSNKNYLLAFTAPNGQIVLIIDFNDPGGYGYGHGIASTQPTVSYASGDANGSWITNSSNGYSGVTTISGTSYTTVNTGGTNSGNLTFDTPWRGFARPLGINDDGYAILAGTGVFAYRSNVANRAYYEVGVLKR